MFMETILYVLGNRSHDPKLWFTAVDISEFYPWPTFSWTEAMKLVQDHELLVEVICVNSEWTLIVSWVFQLFFHYVIITDNFQDDSSVILSLCVTKVNRNCSLILNSQWISSINKK